VAAIVCALQLDHDQPSLPVHAEQIYPASRVLPATKLLADDQNIGIDDVNLIAKQPLKVASFSQTLVRKRRRLQRHNSVLRYFKNCHCFQPLGTGIFETTGVPPTSSR
jgi:hypothetical protein